MEKFFIGTYTGGTSKGIYSAVLDSESKKITNIRLEAELDNPTYLELSADSRFLFAVSETSNGAVASYAISGGDTLKRISLLPGLGGSPCHLAYDDNCATLAVANYGDGKITIIPVGTDGGLESPSRVIEQKGHSINADRQTSAHAHFAAFKNGMLYIVDLGLDRVMAYNQAKDFDIDERHCVAIKPGLGPRHMAFSADASYAYVVTELISYIAVLKKADDGTYKPVQYLSTLPAEFEGDSNCAAIKMSKDGKYVYASNRGHNSIAVFSVGDVGKGGDSGSAAGAEAEAVAGSGADSGILRLIGCFSTGGDHPRDFEFSKDGNFMICANQDSDNMLLFEVDHSNGAIAKVDEVTLPSPVCMKFF